MQEAAMTSTSGREDVEAGVTEPRSLGRGPWAAETQTPGKGTVASLSLGKETWGGGLRPLSRCTKRAALNLVLLC